MTPKLGGWFELGDGSLVKGADEVERIHGEQQRRIRGEDGPEPAAKVRSADRFQDGFVPRADQIAKGEREKDATCHPFGGGNAISEISLIGAVTMRGRSLGRPISTTLSEFPSKKL